MSKYLSISQKSGVLSLRLNRPDKKNAIDVEMYQALAGAIVGADTNPDIRVIYLSGEGDSFCSGNDLKDFLENTPVDQSAPVFQFLSAISCAEKPIIAAVSGLAVGIGTTMLLHCDLVYADDTAKFMLPFVRLGVCTEAGSSLLLPLLCGKQKATEALLFGEPFSASDAKEMGLVNQVVESDALHETALSKAEMLADQPVKAVLATKRLIKKAYEKQVESVMSDESEEFLALLQGDECRSILASFFDRK